MQAKLRQFDAIAGIGTEAGIARTLDRLAFVFLILMALSAPHSIAATQTAWLIGMLFWVARLFFKPRVHFRFGLIDAALWGLFFWTAVSAAFSYDQPTSIDKLRSAAVFLIFYFALYNVRNLRACALVAFVLIGSCMFNVAWVPVERLIGRGVEIHGISPNSPLAKAQLHDGDTLLTANKTTLNSPEELLSIMELNETVSVKFYRPDFELTVNIDRADLLEGDTADEKLGIGSWKKSHNWRSKGFYGHYATYAEVLQLIGSLAFGLLIAGFVHWRGRLRNRNTQDEERRGSNSEGGGLRPPHLVLIFICFAMISFALLLTVTRAPQLGLMISAAVIVLLGLGRKWFLVAGLIFIPVALGGLVFLQQSREVGFLDRNDESTRYRFVMFQDGMRLLTESPRNFIFGIGVDSIKKHWREWGMFEGGKIPIGHFHSTPVQILVERGLPALLLWLMLMGVYIRSLWRAIAGDRFGDWRAKGILLGSLGGTLGFLASSIVHYNFGDQEVVMIFYLLMGLSVRIVELPETPETQF